MLSHSNKGATPHNSHFMKSIIFTAVFSTFGIISYGQEITVQEVPTEKIEKTSDKPQFINTGNPQQDTLNYYQAKDAYYIKKGEMANPNDEIIRKIEIKDQQIKAIQSKMEYVNNNPEEKKKAEESGWFDQMNQTIIRLETQKNELKSTLDPRF